ncbi:hypothetical protein B9Z65_2904 [Elsinoe australis]|uniref:Rhodopsin domain-containing protein n=1 Tax=Elsinoe australis TaxID=40998 RepID=A0A2P7ZTT7_9PEZI|nr:hypothetical protein B9Z65_2904 [Elsinoe australis]
MAIEFVNYDLMVMFSVAVVFLSLPCIATLLRIYVRTFMVKSWGWDDILMIASMLTFTAESALVMSIALQPKNMTFPQLKVLTFEILISSNFYLVTSILFKLSLAIFFLRFLQEPWQRRTILTCTALYTTLGLAFIILLNLQCGNPKDLFSNTLTNHCGPWRILRPLNYTYATINALTDWTFALIPIYTIRHANMPRRARISASFLLGLGAVSSIVSIVRMKYIEGLNVNKNLFPSPAIGVTSCIEMGLGMTAASCATLRPLFRSCMERAKMTLQRTYGTDVAGTEGRGTERGGTEKDKDKDGSRNGGTQGTFASYGVGKGVMESFAEVEEEDGRREVRITGGDMV